MLLIKSKLAFYKFKMSSNIKDNKMSKFVSFENNSYIMTTKTTYQYNIVFPFFEKNYQINQIALTTT